MCRVLILDDDPFFCKTIAEPLNRVDEGRSYHTVSATRVEDALREVRLAVESSKPFDVLLIDLRLSENQDGIEVMQTLLHLSPSSDAIILTGLDDSPDAGLRAYQAGAYRYIYKPVHPKELVLLLQSLRNWRKVQHERSWLQVFNEVAEQALNCLSFQDAAHIFARGALRLGFERARLFEFTSDYPDILVGVCQEGCETLDGFEGAFFAIAEAAYFERAIHTREIQFFKGRELGPALMERTFGESFSPPVGEWAVLPLWISEKFVGIMVVDNASRDHRIHEEDRKQLRLYARLVAGNLERIRLYEQERTSRQRIEYIAEEARRTAQLESEDAHRLDLLQRASVELLNIASQDEEKFWLTLLTLATANYALGFNRAWIFLAEAGNTRLQGKLGVGHLDSQRAQTDWEKDLASQMTFERFLQALHSNTVQHTPLEGMTRDFALEIGLFGGLFKEVLATGQRAVLSSEEALTLLPGPFNRKFAPGDCAVLPFRAGRMVIGVMVVDNKHDGKPILPTTLDRLETFINIAGLVWQNLIQRKQREALLDASNVILGKASQQPLGDSLRRICDSARTVTGAEWAIIYPLKPGGGPYTYDVPNVGYSGDFNPGQIKDKPRQKGVAAHILRSGTLVVGDVGRTENSPNVEKLSQHKFIQRNGIHALIGTPIRSVEREEMLGILFLNYRTAQTFTQQEIMQAESFANLAALAILNARHAEKVSRSLREALSRGETSQRELELIQRVLADSLANSSEPGVIQTLLTNLRRALDHPDINPALVLHHWEAETLEDEPREILLQYTPGPEGGVIKTRMGVSEDKTILAMLRSKHAAVKTIGRRLYAPIALGQTVIGVLSAEMDNAAQAKDYQPVLERFAFAAAMALDNARQQTNLHHVLDAAQAVTAPINLNQTLTAILQSVRNVSPDLSTLTLWYRDPETDCIKMGASFGVRSLADLTQFDPGPESIVSKVMRSKRPIWASPLKKHHLLWGRFVRDEKIVSSAAFPLRADNVDVGAMFFNYRSEHYFTDEEQTIFNILAEVVAASIRDALHLETERKERRRLDAALRTTSAVGDSLSLVQVLQKVLALLRESFPDTNPCIQTFNEDDNLLEFIPAVWNYYRIDNEQYRDRRSLRLDERAIACRVARQTLAEKRMVIENIGDIREDPDYLPLISQTLSELCVSLVAGENLRGVLVLERARLNGFEAEDVELVKAIAQQLSLAIERARQNDQLSFRSTVAAATAWAADIAHDINREVGAIRLYAHLIGAEKDKPNNITGYAQKIEESAARLASAGPWQIPEPRPVIVDTFIQQWVGEFTRNRKETILVQFDFHCTGAAILTNPFAFQRVLRQLVRNAAQAMEQQTERKLTVRTFPAEGNLIEIRFEDTGPGVEEDIRPLILQQQVTTKSGPGGYGLLLTRQMIEDMGGKIRLLPSPPGAGAIFSIKLPIRPG